MGGRGTGGHIFIGGAPLAPCRTAPEKEGEREGRRGGNKYERYYGPGRHPLAYVVYYMPTIWTFSLETFLFG